MMIDVEQMTVTEAAEARNSVRSYKDQPVPEADLREMLRVAGLAPSAFNVQPWRWVVVRDDALREELRQAAYGQAQVTSAPAVIVLYSDMRDVLENAEQVVHPGMGADAVKATAERLRGTWADRSDADRETWGAGQSYIALGYLLLAAQSLGYATSPMLGFEPAKVKALLGLPEHVAIPALVAVGVPDEEGFPHHRHAVDDVTDFR